MAKIQAGTSAEQTGCFGPWRLAPDAAWLVARFTQFGNIFFGQSLVLNAFLGRHSNCGCAPPLCVWDFFFADSDLIH